VPSVYFDGLRCPTHGSDDPLRLGADAHSGQADFAQINDLFYGLAQPRQGAQTQSDVQVDVQADDCLRPQVTISIVY